MTRTQSSCVRVVCVNVEAALSQCIPCSHVRGFGVHWRASAGVANRCAGHNIDIRAQDPRNRRVRSKSERHATRRTSRGSSRVKFTGCPGASQTAATVVKAAEIFFTVDSTSMASRSSRRVSQASGVDDGDVVPGTSSHARAQSADRRPRGSTVTSAPPTAAITTAIRKRLGSNEPPSVSPDQADATDPSHSADQLSNQVRAVEERLQQGFDKREAVLLSELSTLRANAERARKEAESAAKVAAQQRAKLTEEEKRAQAALAVVEDLRAELARSADELQAARREREVLAESAAEAMRLAEEARRLVAVQACSNTEGSEVRQVDDCEACLGDAGAARPVKAATAPVVDAASPTARHGTKSATRSRSVTVDDVRAARAKEVELLDLIQAAINRYGIRRQWDCDDGDSASSSSHSSGDGAEERAPERTARLRAPNTTLVMPVGSISKPPQLHSLNAADIVAFLDEFEMFSDQLVAIGYQRRPLASMLTVDVRRLLPSVVKRFGEVDVVPASEPQRSTVVERILRNIIATPERGDGDSWRTMEAKLQRLQWNVKAASFKDAMLDFQSQWTSLVSAERWRELLTKRPIQKKVVWTLKQLVAPAVFRAEVEDLMIRDNVQDPTAWFAALWTLEGVYDTHQRAYRFNTKTAAARTKTPVSTVVPAGVEKRMMTTPPTATPAGTKPFVTKTTRPPDDAKPARPPPTGGCLNCKGDHWLKDCPRKPSREQRDKLVAELKTRKHTAHVGGAASDGVANVQGHSVDYLLDTGATLNLLSEDWVRAHATGVAITPLATDDLFEVTTACEGVVLSPIGTITVEAVFAPNSGADARRAAIVVHVVPGLLRNLLLIGRATAVSIFGMDTSAWPSMRAEAPPPTAAAAAVGVDAARAGPEDEAQPAHADVEVDVPDLRYNDPKKVYETLRQKLDEDLRDSPFSPEQQRRLRKAVLEDHINAFRLQPSPDDPPIINPGVEDGIRVDIDVAKLHSIPQSRRSYSKPLSDMIQDYIDVLLKCGLVVQDDMVPYASPVHPVRKHDAPPGGTPMQTHRLTIDMRGVNACTIPSVTPIPQLDTLRSFVVGQRFFGKIDLHQGYWQLLLHPESRRHFAIRTDRGTFVPTRLVQGSRNAAGPFQAAMTRILGALLYIVCLCYIDDVLLYGKTTDEFIDAWINVLGALDAANVKISAKKVVFWSRAVMYCGRLFSEQGVLPNPAFIQAVVDMPLPSNAAQLRSALLSFNWMRHAVPRFAELTTPLLELLQHARAIAKSDRNAAWRRVALCDIGWSAESVDAFNRLRRALVQAIALAHPDPDKVFVVTTDASDIAWSGVVTQVGVDEVDLKLADQRHVPIAFISQRFSGPQLRWSVIEKEGFAVVSTLLRTQSLLYSKHPIRLLVDHSNLQHVFRAVPTASEVRGQKEDKLSRWRITLEAFDYAIWHIPGEENVAADMFSRWAAPVSQTPAQLHASELACIVTTRRRAREIEHLEAAAPAVDCDDDDDVDAPTATLPPTPPIATSHEAILQRNRAIPEPGPRPGALRRDPDGVWTTASGQVFVPDHGDLRNDVIRMAHQFSAGHQGQRTTLRHVAYNYWWPSVREDVTQLVKSCGACAAARPPFVQRALRNTLNATMPNQVLHFDYMFVRHAEDGTPGDAEYVLVMLDECTRFVRFVPTAAEDAASTAQAILAWFADYGIVSAFYSDQGTHFNNDVIKQLAKHFGIAHHFTATYAPWSNGTVERRNSQLLHVLRTLHTDTRVPLHQWPLLCPTAATMLNTTPSGALGGVCPATLFLARAPRAPTDLLMRMDPPALAPVHTRAKNVAKATIELQRTLVEANRVVEAHTEPVTVSTSAHRIDFGVGDQVLYVLPAKPAKDKLTSSWRGPAIVEAAPGPYVFDIRDVRSKKAYRLHAAFLQRAPASL